MSEQELWDRFLLMNIDMLNTWIHDNSQIGTLLLDIFNEDQLFFFNNVLADDLFGCPAHEFRINKQTVRMENVCPEFKVPRWDYLMTEYTIDRDDRQVPVLEATCERWPEYNTVRLMYV